MKIELLSLCLGGSLILSAAAAAAPRTLPLRLEPGTCIYGASTSQTVETTYGTNLTGLAFSGTTTYHFYTPPLALPTALTTKDKGGGTIFMKNISPSHANDFVVSGGMRYFDYNPATGTESLIVDTGTSASKSLNRGQSVNWALPNASLSAAATIPTGHLLHVAVTLNLISGTPAGFGQLMYNGAKGTSTEAYLSEDNAASWTFSPPVLPCQKTTACCITPDHCAKISAAGFPNQTYLVQATASLSSPSWSTIGTNTAGSDGLFVYVDTDAMNHPVRFYRTSTP